MGDFLDSGKKEGNLDVENKIIDLETERDKRQRSDAFQAALEGVKRASQEPLIGVEILDQHFKEHPYKFPKGKLKKRK